MIPTAKPALLTGRPGSHSQRTKTCQLVNHLLLGELSRLNALTCKIGVVMHARCGLGKNKVSVKHLCLGSRGYPNGSDRPSPSSATFHLCHLGYLPMGLSFPTVNWGNGQPLAWSCSRLQGDGHCNLLSVWPAQRKCSEGQNSVSFLQSLEFPLKELTDCPQDTF